MASFRPAAFSISRLVVLGIVLCAFPLAVAAAPYQKASPSNEEAWRLDCGDLSSDPGITDPSGNLWMRDEEHALLGRWGFAFGAVASTPSNITGTSFPQLYRTHRHGWTDMAYRVELPNGVYRVKLMFAETFWTQPGQRVFDVALEGQLVLDNHDVLAHRAPLEADDHVSTVTVQDRVLDVTFPSVTADNAFIAGIEVVPQSLSEDDFLDFLQRAHFRYFLAQTTPVTGLIRDKADSFGPGHADIVTTGPLGFAMSIFTIAAQRGWLTPSDARNRVMAILAPFRPSGPGPKAEVIHGFWYHGLNVSESPPGVIGHGPGWEVSTVDSALVVLGALQAGEYFRSSYPEVAAAAAEIFEAMEWDWWLNRLLVPSPDPAELNRGQFIAQAWKPNGSVEYPIPAPGGGFFSRAWWDRYSEALFVNLLALGSPGHPVGVSAWTAMRRYWKEDLGRRFIDIPPLFAHQFHHLYYDLRGLHDSYADYRENTRRVTLYHKEYAAARPADFPDAELWGMSNGLIPDGNPNAPTINYGEYGPGADGNPGDTRRGTVMPTAALTSMEITPVESMRAARHMYFQYKQHVWGRYGFTDSFNPRIGFRSPQSFALENGSFILAIENRRTGMVRDTFMQNPYVQQGLSLAGFKAQGTAPLLHASHQEGYPGSTVFAAGLAADGNMSTRWSSGGGPDAWIYFDFGAPRLFSRVTIHWEAAYASRYRLEWSGDGAAWTTLKEVHGGDGGTDVVDTPLANARFLRIVGLERGLSCCGYSIWEMSSDIRPVVTGSSVNLVLTLIE